jgi:very-short-patch-repair endonuclease
MDERRLAALARRQGGLVSTAQLEACGLSRSGVRHRVAAGRLFRVRRGVYALGPVLDSWSSYWSAVLAVGVETAALSHWSAAAAQGFAPADRGRTHVTVPVCGGRSAAGLRIHQARNLRAGDLVRVRGLRATGPARTVLDIAGEADDGVVRRVIREAEFVGALRPGHLTAAIDGRGGHPGVGRIRRVDPHTVESALGQTPLEDELDALIQTTALPEPHRQYRLKGPLGDDFRADFAWPEFRLIAEADGRSAHVRVSAMTSDRRRDAEMAAAGWLTMRFTRAQVVVTPEEVRRQLTGAASCRGWTTRR